MRGPLGRYLLNVSTAAEQCSKVLCGWRGRCLRRDAEADVYLHLNPLTHLIQEQGGRLRVRGQLGVWDQRRLREDFQCQCYTGHHGEDCSQRSGATAICHICLPGLTLPLFILALLH